MVKVLCKLKSTFIKSANDRVSDITIYLNLSSNKIDNIINKLHRV